MTYSQAQVVLRHDILVKQYEVAKKSGAMLARTQMGDGPCGSDVSNGFFAARLVEGRLGSNNVLIVCHCFYEQRLGLVEKSPLLVGQALPV